MCEFIAMGSVLVYLAARLPDRLLVNCCTSAFWSYYVCHYFISYTWCSAVIATARIGHFLQEYEDRSRSRCYDIPGIVSQSVCLVNEKRLSFALNTHFLCWKQAENCSTSAGRPFFWYIRNQPSSGNCIYKFNDSFTGVCRAPHPFPEIFEAGG